MNTQQWKVFTTVILAIFLMGRALAGSQELAYESFNEQEFNDAADFGSAGDREGADNPSEGWLLPGTCLEDLGPRVSPAEITHASLMFRSNDDASYVQSPLLSTEIEFHVTGMIVRAEIRQWFMNPTDEWLEGIYVFPLPPDSAVDHLTMRVGDRLIEGEIQEKAAARKTYEQARSEGKRASLVEQERPNMFTTSLANIAPGEEIAIILQLQFTVVYDHGRFQLTFPTVVGPRFIPGSVLVEGISGSGWAMNTDLVPDARRISPFVQAPQGGTINPLALLIDLEAGFLLDDIISPSHRISVLRHGDDMGAEISLSDDGMVADRDFILEWRPRFGYEPQAALFTEETETGIYAFLMVVPPETRGLQEPVLPRELIIVIDTSGSMAGSSLDQAKAAVLEALDSLTPEDTFMIIQFNSIISRFSQRSSRVTGSSLALAKKYVTDLRSTGGTEMVDALRAALEDRQPDPKRVRQVIFITDGCVGNDEQVLRLVEQSLGRSRFFPVAIGSAPNSYLLKRAADLGRGTFVSIGRREDVHDRMAELFSKLEQPLVHSIDLQWPDPDCESSPNPIPDLYATEPLIVTGRLFHGAGDVLVGGMRGGDDWQVSLSIGDGREEGGIAKLWARTRIESLMDEYRRGNEREAIREQIIELSLTHHLVSPFTSLVAVDMTPARPVEDTLHRVACPINPPAGWQVGASGTTLPQTATAAPLLAVLGCAFLLLALIMPRQHVLRRVFR